MLNNIDGFLSIEIAGEFVRSLSLDELNGFRSDLTGRIIKCNNELESLGLRIANPINKITDLSRTKELTKATLQIADAEFQARYDTVMSVY